MLQIVTGIFENVTFCNKGFRAQLQIVTVGKTGMFGVKDTNSQKPKLSYFPMSIGNILKIIFQ
ncbi:hypothetical protein McpSp1_13160 [Methanocorpusculaceae archaeon Sp1]|nr:hypothetical protein [Methanocorpusculaceae archaeon Sp1]